MAEQATTPQDQSTAQESGTPKKGRAWFFWPVVGLGALVAVFVIGLVAALLIAVLANPTDAANWVGIIRDLFIIVLAMEGMMMGIALIVLVLQLAALVNLLQNEIKPVVDNANQTVTTVRGTAQFMSQNVVEPVIKFGALAAGIGGVARELFRLRRSVRAASQDGKKSEKQAK